MYKRVGTIGLRTLLFLILAATMLYSFTRPSAQPPQRPWEKEIEHSCAAAKRFAKLLRASFVQTQNQADYDVTYYALMLVVDPSSQTVSGSVRVDARALPAVLTHVELDLLDNMNVTGVTSAGVPVSFSHAGDILDITLDRTYNEGEIVTISVSYNGTPDPSCEAFVFDTRNGAPMIWTLSEPYGARSWWPCKDVPEDKADSADVVITVPDTLIVASNGKLMSQVGGSGLTTYHWHESYPIATYLLSLAIHPYAQFSDWYHYSPTDSMEVSYYVFPENLQSRQVDYAKTVSMIELFAGLFGEYPFVTEKYGHAEFMSSFGGMENQTISSLRGATEVVIAHELAHQWWGDMITCRDFHHIWLNEGFAVYCEALWFEHRFGFPGYQASIIAHKYLGPGTVYVPDDSDVNRILHYGLSYCKAAWVLHMLRHVVGEDTFFDIFPAYYNDADLRYGTAATEDFQRVCETVSGADLEYFFHQWIYEEYFPTYAVGWSAVAGAGASWDLTVEIDQRQTNYVFKMPANLFVQTTSGDTTVVFWDSLAAQTALITTDGKPIAVELDPDEWILRNIEAKYPVSNADLTSNTPTLDVRLDFCNGKLDTFIVTIDLPDVLSVDEIPESLITLVPADPPNSTIRFISEGPIYADSAATEANGYTTTITHSDITGSGADVVSVAIDGALLNGTAPIYVQVCGSGSGKVKPHDPGEAPERVPGITSLGNALPSPFNRETTIPYQVGTQGTHVRIAVYDAAGRLVRTLVDRWQAAGMYQAAWDGRDGSGKTLSSGVYFYRMTAGGFVDSKKLVLLK